MDSIHSFTHSFTQPQCRLVSTLQVISSGDHVNTQEGTINYTGLCGDEPERHFQSSCYSSHKSHARYFLGPTEAAIHWLLLHGSNNLSSPLFHPSTPIIPPGCQLLVCLPTPRESVHILQITEETQRNKDLMAKLQAG
jgi:hypothetical protein